MGEMPSFFSYSCGHNVGQQQLVKNLVQNWCCKNSEATEKEQKLFAPLFKFLLVVQILLQQKQNFYWRKKGSEK